MTIGTRGARLAAPLLLALAVAAAGCSSDSSGTSATPTSSWPTPTPTRSATTDAAAVAALNQAQATLRADRSYRFDATVTIATTHSVEQRVTGSVVRGQGVAYTYTAGRTKEQVVRLRGATYVRVVPKPWSKLRKPRPVTDPTTGLLAILHGIQAPHLTAPTEIAGVLDPAAAKTADVPTVEGILASVKVTFDAARHVTRLSIDSRSRTTNATASVPVTVTTTYADFNRLTPLHKPV